MKKKSIGKNRCLTCLKPYSILTTNKSEKFIYYLHSYINRIQIWFLYIKMMIFLIISIVIIVEFI